MRTLRADHAGGGPRRALRPAAADRARRPLQHRADPGRADRARRRERGAGARLRLLGARPHWAKEKGIGNRLINARAESLAEKPAFRSAFKHRRCLIPADGFYEWKPEGGGKQPWLLRLRGGAPFAFAGLWEHWTDPATREPFESCTIVTTRPNELVATVHDRMPAILPRERHRLWLDPGTYDPVALGALLAPIPADAMEAFPVSKRVNSPVNEDPRCIEPLH